MFHNGRKHQPSQLNYHNLGLETMCAWVQLFGFWVLIKFHHEDLADLGTDDVVEKALNAQQIEVDKKNRRVSDFVEMIYDEFSKGKSVRVVIKRDELIDPITNIIKESGFNKVARVGRTNMMDVKIPSDMTGNILV